MCTINFCISFTTEQTYYLKFLEYSDSATYKGSVEPCSGGCSSSDITLPYNFPFGGYFHQTAFVSLKVHTVTLNT